MVGHEVSLLLDRLCSTAVSHGPVNILRVRVVELRDDAERVLTGLLHHARDRDLRGSSNRVR